MAHDGSQPPEGEPDDPAKKTTAKKATAKKAAAKGAKKAAKKGTKKAAKKGAKKVAKKGAQRVEGAGGMPDPATVERPWLDAYPPHVPTTFDYPSVPLTRLLDDAAADFPEQEAIHFLGASSTYRQLLDQVDRFATALAALGVRKGDRVGVVLPNCPQHVVAVFATLRLGAVVVENNPLYSQGELAHQLGDAGCKVVVCLDPIYRRLADIRADLPDLETVVATGIQDALPFPKSWLFPLKGKRDGTFYKIPAEAGVLRMTELIEQSAPAPPPVEVEPGTDLAMLLYTGGTTGTSKGVMLTHANLVTNAFQARLWMPDIQAGAENVLCVLPFFHSYGLTTCLSLGVLSAATLTLLPRFDVKSVLKTIDRRKPTLFPGVPTLYVAINHAEDVQRYDLSSVRACLSGAAPLPVDVATGFEALTGGKLREGYGLTESSPITHANPIYGKAKKGSIGLPVTDTVCALRDVEDPSQPAPEHGPGELAITGPQIMAGYWNRPEETAETVVDGWLLTGDVATMDEEGYFSIVDRKKDLILVSGYNVYPREVEDAIREHPAVVKAAVAGVPDAYRGEVVKAYVVRHEGAALSDDALLDFLGERLASYKLPKAIAFREELPETMIGKVLRRKLVEEERGARPDDPD